MNFSEYKNRYYVDPRPKLLYQFDKTTNLTLYYEEITKAVHFYSRIIGSPHYIQGTGTFGWFIVNDWFTLLRGQNGNSHNVEINFKLNSFEEAKKMSNRIVKHKGVFIKNIETMLYEPVRNLSHKDPFGVDIMLLSPPSVKSGVPS